MENQRCMKNEIKILEVWTICRPPESEKSKTQKSLGVLRNIENFDHNSAENDDFDNGRNLKTQKADPESIR